MINRQTLVAAWLAASMLLAGAAVAQTLRIGLPEDLDTFDPPLLHSYVDRIVLAALCDKLIDIGPELEIVPQLATEWQWTDDGKGLVMKLRPGINSTTANPSTQLQSNTILSAI